MAFKGSLRPQKSGMYTPVYKNDKYPVQFCSVHFISHNSRSTKQILQIHIYKNINILSINSIKEESLDSKASDKGPLHE